jgi:hypothetical protein
MEFLVEDLTGPRVQNKADLLVVYYLVAKFLVVVMY